MSAGLGGGSPLSAGPLSASPLSAGLVSGTASTSLLLIVLAGAIAGLGAALLVAVLTGGATPHRPDAVWSRRATRAAARIGRRGLVAAAVALLVLVVTHWVVAAAAGAALVMAAPALLGGSGAEKAAAARLEALAIWTESLRDTIAGAVGLEQAILATAATASPSIAPHLRALAGRLRTRTPLPQALQRLADDLDDPSADLIIATLMLNARLRGPGLRAVLTSLADSARAELDMRGRITAGRASTRRSVQIVIGITAAFVVWLVETNPDYVAPYDSVEGQGVLLLVVALFAAGLLWMRSLADVELPGRMLVTEPDVAGAER